MSLHFGLSPVIKHFDKQLVPPSPAYVSGFISKHKLKVLSPSNITPAKLNSAFMSNIRAWFNFMFNKDIKPSVNKLNIFNADEWNADFCSFQKLIVPAEAKRAPASSEDHTYYHISIMTTIGPSCIAPPPFIIISALKMVPPELLEYKKAGSCEIHVNASGWMDRNAFYSYAVHFCSWITICRSLGVIPLNSPVFFILDSHPSRLCPSALVLFEHYFIFVFTLHGNLTHIMQPFDVGIACPLRNAFRKLMRRRKIKWVEEHNDGQKMKAADRRKLIVECAIDAEKTATSFLNKENAFRTTGLFPINPEILISNPYVSDDTEDPKYPDGIRTGEFEVPFKWLTSPSFFFALQKREMEKRQK
ncbi:putative DDE superfamily endonuclease containing protein [Monocercomonoides exilis]|uniref:putative DDE superfamily endonuclease containing protein n=1 Tax=Monocercomonoides exilis TaxID=2049356 RepID=UPI00355AA265|nr:putative DDE superfamily endonuclease containing protein [Monocercomonoides exilis]|eukprot:MONOS_4876.1-p1 / transcript=MONOS_4876.1 / gene=MONOS_4876 / organism=Monocercomonoides_exilis_PA203 / gene_product=DDE superfamily endonuclease containing protein / transcript_product=DDE superfamily endonuclease containing protein / location=Mono_scaffold00136:36407-37486(+) / protein_length=359 / sequence_SO=supercontig / SO=protein_coding / is_pseudo=false